MTESPFAEVAMTPDKQKMIEYTRLYLKNRPLFPLDELAKYRGKHIAWSPDGTSIVASAETLDELMDVIEAGGDDMVHCLVDYVPDADSLIG
jgi:hypothetical protein